MLQCLNLKKIKLIELSVNHAEEKKIIGRPIYRSITKKMLHNSRKAKKQNKKVCIIEKMKKVVQTSVI
jgi:hypothetical protein